MRLRDLWQPQARVPPPGQPLLTKKWTVLQLPPLILAMNRPLLLQFLCSSQLLPRLPLPQSPPLLLLPVLLPPPLPPPPHCLSNRLRSLTRFKLPPLPVFSKLNLTMPMPRFSVLQRLPMLLLLSLPVQLLPLLLLHVLARVPVLYMMPPVQVPVAALVFLCVQLPPNAPVMALLLPRPFLRMSLLNGAVLVA